MSEKVCLAAFDEPASVRNAVGQLAQLGLDGDRLEIISSEPIHIRPDTRKTHLGKFALAGAVIGATAGYMLAAVTALAYPIVKGGMPIVAPWTAGIITYETTMLGAILATLVGLLFELRLPNFKPLPYDKIVSDGRILLVVRCPEGGKRIEVERAVNHAGGEQVRWLDG
jgi:hypothetical protein